MHLVRKRARQLRNNLTDAERHLWRQLRLRNLQGLKFRRQHPIAGYIADFACIEARVVVELDGGQHADATEHDEARTRLGYSPRVTLDQGLARFAAWWRQGADPGTTA